MPLVRSAGAVFCGPYAPASVGDYLAGPSHVLPTYGSARFSSALGVDDFSKQIHVISLDQPALAKLAPHVQWQQSYVTEGKTFCVYLADDESAVREHAKLSGFPANRITEVKGVIDPTTANA